MNNKVKITLNDEEVLSICNVLLKLDVKNIRESLHIAKNHSILKLKAQAIEEVIHKNKDKEVSEVLEELRSQNDDYELFKMNPENFESITPIQAIILENLLDYDTN